MSPTKNKDTSSFRDPSGFIFHQDGTIFRQINHSYREDYDHLISSGLFDTLVDAELLVPHDEIDGGKGDVDGYLTIKPERIPFISYPYEWSFSAFQQAALTTLRIQHLALEHEMILKDASAFNIQFLRGKPVLIDTLSFQRWTDGRPWDGYRQYCQHFLAPLALMSYSDIRLSKLLIHFIDGIPLDLASRLLPLSSYLRPPILTHIHLHSKMQAKSSQATSTTRPAPSGAVSKNSLMGMNQNLEAGTRGLHWQPGKTAWGDYYETYSYSSVTIEHKESLVSEFLDLAKPSTVWDMGANTGKFSRIASSKGIFTVSMDIDPGAAELNYQEAVTNSETHLLPLIIDLTNPSPNLGWNSKERTSFIERGPVDAILALALIHHLVIGNNLPLIEIAGFFASLCDWLLIEFIPKEDVQIQKMLSVREDIFDDYSQENFEREFTKYFERMDRTGLHDSSRTLYTYKKRQGL